MFYNKNQKIGKNRCLVFLSSLFWFGSVMLLLKLFCLMNQGRTKGEGWSTANKLKPPPPHSNLIAGRPQAALLFWFFGDFRCGALLYMVILVIYEYTNR